MTDQRLAIYLQDAHPIAQGIDICRYAEERGFEAVWQAESRLVRDAIVPMAAFAAHTTKLKVGSGVINNWTRNIGLLAATFLGAVLVGLAAGAVMHVLWRVGAWEAGQFRDKLVRLRKAAHRAPEAVVEPPAPAAKPDEPDAG